MFHSVSRGTLRRGLLVATLCVTHAAHAQGASTLIDLPAAPLNLALDALARQTGAQILFADRAAPAGHADALKGRYTAREALDQLLPAHGLEAVERSPGVFLVRSATQKAAAPQPPPAQATGATSSAPVTAPSEPSVAEVVVTGEKIARRLGDTTSSVAVTTSGRIAQENIRSLYEILDRTANVTQTSSDSSFTIRGMSNTGVGQAPLVSVYLDGAAIPAGAGPGSPFSTWDLDQVEILRGPQSTLQGESAIAGAITLHTQDPTMYWEAHARAQYSNPGARDLAVAGGGPLIDDELAFRVSVQNQDSSGWVYNPTRREQADAHDDTTVRAKLRWTPVSLPGLAVKLSFTHENYAGPPALPASVDRTVPDYYDHREYFANSPNDVATHTSTGSAQVDYTFSPAWTLSSVTSWTQLHAPAHYDSDSTADDVGFASYTNDARTRQQEIRLHHSGGWLDGLLGAYWSQRDTSTDSSGRYHLATPVDTIASVLQSQGIPAGLANTYSSLYAQALPVIPYGEVISSSNQDRNLALFGDGTAHMGEHWSLLGGFRWDKQRYTLGADAGSVDFLGTFPDPAAYGAPGSQPYLLISGINQAVAATLAGAISDQPAGTRHFSAFLPKLGLRYAWDKDLSLSFVAQRGYRAGGSTYDIQRAQNFAYDPEYTNNYELALRSQWLDETLTLNVNAFYTDWKDKQVSISGNLGQYDTWIANASRARLYGLEIEASQRVSRHFDWYASLGHQRTRYGSFDSPAGAAVSGVDLTGQEFTYAPHWTGALGANLSFAHGWFLNGNASYHSPEIGIQTTTGNQVLSSVALLNGRFGYGRNGWSAYVFGSNLLDRKYLRYGSVVSNFVYLGDPRVVGGGVEARW